MRSTSGHRVSSPAMRMVGRTPSSTARLLSAAASGTRGLKIWPLSGPWLGRFELGGEAQEGGFLAKAGGELDAHGQAVVAPRQRNRHGWGASDVGRLGVGDAA